MGFLDAVSGILGSAKGPKHAKRSQTKAPEFVLFQDAQGNFSILRPKALHYDEKIAVLDGKYTIAFESDDCKVRFCISLDTRPCDEEDEVEGKGMQKKFDFASYAKERLESPSSGIYTPVKKTAFRNMEAYKREYSYSHGGQEYRGGGIMFYTGSNEMGTVSQGIVFDISWSAPRKEWENHGPIFEQMIESLLFRKRLS